MTSLRAKRNGNRSYVVIATFECDTTRYTIIRVRVHVRFKTKNGYEPTLYIIDDLTVSQGKFAFATREKRLLGNEHAFVHFT